MALEKMGMVQPQSIEAEQSVLGSMLLDNEAVLIAMEIIDAEDFYRPDHKQIFTAVNELFNTSQPIDLITVSEKLGAHNMLDKIGGLEYLTLIAEKVPTTANTGHYARIVKEKATLRRIIKIASEGTKKGYEGSEDAAMLLDWMQSSLFDIGQDKNVKGISHVKEILDETIGRLEELYNTGGSITGVPTGFTDLDKKLSGLHNSDLILIAARPAMGKTAFALNIAQNAAIKANVPVAVFNLEMSKEQLVNRILQSEVMINGEKMRTGRLEDDDFLKIAKAIGPVSSAPIYIDDTSGITVTEIRAKCRRLKFEKQLGLIIIDYLQLMQGSRRSENRQQEISEISRSLKILAKDLDVPVLALSQLNRAPDARSEHRPMLSDLRESGAIEQDADIVMFIYRDEVYNPETEFPNEAEIIIAKHRHGSTGPVKLRWFGEYTKFVNLKRDDRPDY